MLGTVLSQMVEALDARTEELKQKLLALSRQNPKKYYTFTSVFGQVDIHASDGHPKNDADSEQCYRAFGGFFKNGEIVKPSASWMKQFNFIPAAD